MNVFNISYLLLNAVEHLQQKQTGGQALRGSFMGHCLLTLAHKEVYFIVVSPSRKACH